MCIPSPINLIKFKKRNSKIKFGNAQNVKETFSHIFEQGITVRMCFRKIILAVAR